LKTIESRYIGNGPTISMKIGMMMQIDVVILSKVQFSNFEKSKMADGRYTENR